MKSVVLFYNSASKVPTRCVPNYVKDSEFLKKILENVKKAHFIMTLSDSNFEYMLHSGQISSSCQKF